MGSADIIHAQAAIWLDRMNRAAFDSANGPGFDAWMNADPRHRAAFAELAAIWDSEELALACTAPPAASSRSAAVISRTWRRVLATTAIAACAAGLALVVMPALPRAYASDPGRARLVTLADGSTIQLGGNSTVRVRLLPWRRDVKLDRGEASFDIAHDADRPFTVQVDATRVTVLGTAFHVDRLAPNRMLVGVSRGRVQVDARGSGMALTAAQAAQVRAGKLLRVPLQPEQERASKWFVARDAPLADLAEKLRRYSSRRINVGSDKAARLRVTGRFDVSDVEGTLATLNQAYDIQVAVQPSIIYVW